WPSPWEPAISVRSSTIASWPCWPKKRRWTSISSETRRRCRERRSIPRWARGPDAPLDAPDPPDPRPLHPDPDDHHRGHRAEQFHGPLWEGRREVGGLPLAAPDRLLHRGGRLSLRRGLRPLRAHALRAEQ